MPRKRSARRYASAAALVDELTRFLEGKPIVARPLSRPGRIWRWCLREPVVAGLVASLLVILVVASSAAWLYRRQAAQLNEQTKQLSNQVKREKVLVASKKEARKQAEQNSFALLQIAAATAAERNDLPQAKQLLGDIQQWARSRTTDRDPGFVWHYLKAVVDGPMKKLGTGTVLTMAYSRDGKWLATGDNNGIVRLWDAEAGREVHALKVHDRPIQKKAKGNLTTVYTTEMGGSYATMGDGKTFSELDSREQTGAINGLAFSPDGSLIASASGDGSIRIWKTASGETVAQIVGGENTTAYSVAFTDDGTRVMSGVAVGGDRFVRSWDVWNRVLKENTQVPKGVWNCFTTNADNTRYAWDAGRGDTVHVWDRRDGRRFPPLEKRGVLPPVSYITLSPDGRRLAASFSNRAHDHSDLEEILVWDVETGSVVQSITPRDTFAVCLTFSPDGSTIAGGCDDHTIRIWEVTTGKELAVKRSVDSLPLFVVFRPDGTRLAASGDSNPSVRIWDTHGETYRRTINGYDRASSIDHLRYVADGKQLLSVARVTPPSEAGFLSTKIWDAATGLEVASIRGKVLGISHDGNRFATCDAGSDKRT